MQLSSPISLDADGPPPSGGLTAAPSVTVVANDELAANFHLITLEGAVLKGITWMSGQDIRIAHTSSDPARSYTPLAWNSADGRVCILGYAHGAGPGSRWLRGLRAGMSCIVSGTGPTFDPDCLGRLLVFFGDETSMGLACNLVQCDPMAWFIGHLEVDDVDSCRTVLTDLALSGFDLIRREAGDRHLDLLEPNLPALAAEGTFILAGKASTINRLKSRLLRLGVAPNRIIARHYWNAG